MASFPEDPKSARRPPEGEAAVTSRRFPATLEGLSAAAEHVDVALAKSLCPLNVASKFMIAFDEVGSNVVQYSGARDFDVEVTCLSDPPAARIVLSDAGIPYDPLRQEEPDLSLPADERPIGGLGIFMTKKLMDRVTYRRAEDRNILTLYKKFE